MSASLRCLSDSEILSRTKTLVADERRITLGVLLHLNEVERRKLHLKNGHSSMFDYCTSGLGYSEGAAMRRITTARCIEKHPEIRVLLEAGRVNLGTVARVSKVLTRDNCSTVLARIAGRSLREVEGIVAAFDPEQDVPRDRARTIVVRVPLHLSPPIPPQDPARKPEFIPHEDDHRRNDGKKSSTASDEQAGGSRCPSVTVTERRTVIQFTAKEAFMAKLERARSLVWHRLPVNASFEQVFEVALDLLIEKHDPAARETRREARGGASREVRRPGEGTRYIPARIRDEVALRDRQQCTYVGPGGRRCQSTAALQVDHVKPVARGGASTLDNLRLLCAYHNRFEAERLMGPIGRPPQ